MPGQADFGAIFSKRASSWETRDNDDEEVKAGLALSGGGFRAMLFHVGALRRLHEVGALLEVERISSVSGGSITSAMLARAWDDLKADPANMAVFEKLVQEKLFDVASQRIDISAGLSGMLRPGRSVAQSVAKRYEKIFPDYMLQDLPYRPWFVFCTTNLGTGSLMRFAKVYSADRRVGIRRKLDLPIAQVVAASAAFPPVLSPMRITLGDGQDLTEQFPGDEPELANTTYASKLELSDGGVYDNLGLQPLDMFHTVLVSDGGGPFRYEDKVATDWLRHMIRAWKVADNQVRSLRRSELITEFKNDRRNGVFWGINTPYGKYPKNAITVDDTWTTYLQGVPTRLHKVDKTTRKQLINFSYCLADAAMRSYLIDDADLPPAALPYPEEPLDQPAPGAFKAPAIWKFWK